MKLTTEEALKWTDSFVTDQQIHDALLATVRHIHVEVGVLDSEVQFDLDPRIFRAHLASWKRKCV